MKLCLSAAHLQTRVLFGRFIPSASASKSPFPIDPSLKVPDLKPESSELTAEKVDQHIEGAFEIATYLRRNVVQGRRTEEGNYGEFNSDEKQTNGGGTDFTNFVFFSRLLQLCESLKRLNGEITTASNNQRTRE